MYSILSDYQIKIDFYKHTLVYSHHMVIRNQKSTNVVLENKRKKTEMNITITKKKGKHGMMCPVK